MKKISYYHNFSKSKFSKLTNQERFEMIYNDNFWESNESSSGIGSEIKNTKEVLRAIKLIIKQYKIRSIIDIPCGDFNWMSSLDCLLYTSPSPRDKRQSRMPACG